LPIISSAIRARAHDEPDDADQERDEDGGIELPDARRDLERPIAIAKIVDDVVAVPSRCDGRSQSQAENRNDRAQDESLHGATIGADEVETDVAVARDAGGEADAPVDQIGEAKNKERNQEHIDQRDDVGGDEIGDETSQHDQATLEDGQRLSVIVESMPVDASVAVEITLAAYLGPGGVDADRQNREKNVDDPDPEILSCRAPKHDRKLPLDRCGHLGRSQYTVIHESPRCKSSVHTASVLSGRQVY
jgi:hypothetical protein